MLAAMILLLATTYDTSAVNVTIAPQRVLIEQTTAGQELNFDIIIDNRTDAPLDIDEIRLSVYDRAGKLVLRRFVDGNGTRPSIRTIDVQAIPARGRALVFNPFHTFDREIELDSLVFSLKLSTKGGSLRYVAAVTVKPRPYTPKARLILPIEGRAIVYDGHDFYAHHRRWDYTIPGLQQLGFRTNFMRYSYDFVPIDEDANPTRGPEESNESWIGFGREVRAAADGIVAAVEDSQPDNRKFDPAVIARRGTMALWGNYVVLDHGNGEFSLYGHVRQRSSRVAVGQRVRRGQTVAAIGASGSSSFPHLHFELQSGVTTDSEGLPSTFHDFSRILGRRNILVKRGTVNSGELVSSP